MRSSRARRVHAHRAARPGLGKGRQAYGGNSSCSHHRRISRRWSNPPPGGEPRTHSEYSTHGIRRGRFEPMRKRRRVRQSTSHQPPRDLIQRQMNPILPAPLHFASTIRALASGTATVGVASRHKTMRRVDNYFFSQCGVQIPQRNPAMRESRAKTARSRPAHGQGRTAYSRKVG